MKKNILFLSVIVSLLGINCMNGSEDVTGTEQSNVSYSTQVQPIFNSRCVSCHGSNGGVDLSSYSALMSSVGINYGTGLVVAGDADASGLVDKIEANPQFGTRMPQGGTLSGDQIQTIIAWINEGALDN